MIKSGNILTGDETMPFGNVLFMSMVTLFFASGAFIAFLSILYSTYVMWPVFSLIPSLASINSAIFFAQGVDFMLRTALLLCAPFVLVCLLTDVALGLVNRFSPQLNVFILSMPIKSGICAFLIIFYIAPFFKQGSDLIASSHNMLQLMLRILAP